MKIKAKLLIIALILALFSIGAVAAATENATLGSGDLNSVSYETPVSLSLETETTNVDSSASDGNQLSSQITDEENNIEDYKSSSDDVNLNDTIEVKSLNKKSSLLGATNDDVLGATITPAGNTFQHIRNAIGQAQNGDIIDLGGRTYTGSNANFDTGGKKITIQNGVLDAIDAPAMEVKLGGANIKNVHFTNFNSNVGNRVFTFSGSTIENLKITNCNHDVFKGIFTGFYGGLNAVNVTFDNIVSGTCVLDMNGATLTNGNFTNSRVTDNTHDEDTGQFTVMVNSKMDNCNFINTSSNQHSGAICMAKGENTVINSNFINCTAWVGGAIYAHGDFAEGNKKYTIENCKFINCSAEEEGGALGLSHNNMDVKNCVFINNTATKGAGIMVGGIDHPKGMDGDNSHGHNITIENCYFEKNVAIEEGGAVHISGDNNTILKSEFYDNEALEGGAVHITGDNAAAKDSIFDDNFAHGGKGAAIYVKGDNASLDNSKFTRHDSEMGTVYIEGDHFNCTDSEFSENTASHGGAGIYVEGDYTYISHSSFRNNNASMHGGAIHTVGDHAKILHSNFTYNNAIPSIRENPEYGLGGVIYIDGDYNEVSFSKFKHNTARNGSAIYNRGDEFVLNDDTFENNQAWSYFLFTEAKPPEAYWSEDMEFLVNVTLVAGDNLINAIYNDWHKPTPHGVIDEITFHNVTYTLKPNDHYPTGIRTTTDLEKHPVLGVENSQDGKYLYQDAREDDQVIKVNITYKDGKVFEYEGKTDMFGNVLLALKKENMSDGQFHPGVYEVTAAHPDDDIYTAIDNSTTFKILPHVDLSVTKTSDKDVYIVGEKAIFTIKVNGVGTNATNVKVKDILPASLKYRGHTATKGTYDSVNNVWDIGFLPHLGSETLKLTVLTTELGAFDNVVNVTCTERDWNLSNNVDNKTIHVDLYYTKEANMTNVSAGENLEYYLRVFNEGDTDYKDEIQIRDTLPQGIKYLGEYELQGADLVRYINYGDQQIWYVTNISAGTRAKITIKAQALEDGIWNNTMIVWDLPEVNATVNVTHVADLQIIKTVSVPQVSKGDIINWTIVVINHGPSVASNVVVKDILPFGLEQYATAIPDYPTRFDRSTGTWTIGTLEVEKPVKLVIPTRVTIYGRNITNTANVTSTTPDPDLTNNEDNETVEFYPDVSVVKTVSARTTSHGSIVTWTIKVTNNGPHDATGVYVLDKLPAGLRYINSTADIGEYMPSGRWNIGDLAEGKSVVLTINTEVTAYEGFITNNVTVYVPNDGDPSNNYDEDYTEVITKADVGVVKLVSKQISHYGDEVTWTLVVTNYGPNVAENVVLIDFLPIDDLDQIKQPFVSKGQISHQGITGRWDIGNMAVGEKQYCEVYTKVKSTDTTIINVVTVTSDTEDPNLSNNRAENGTYVPPECDVGVIKKVDKLSPNIGDTVVWTITVVNHGPDVAKNVVVTDVLPAGLQYVSNTVPTIGSYSHNRNTWTIDDLAVDARHDLTITTRVTATGEITNEVNVTTSTYEYNLDNNYDNETIDVPNLVDLEIIKLVSDKNPKYGDLINWTIIVTNYGPDTAKDVIVNDKLPAGLIYVDDSTHGEDYNPIGGKWNVGDLKANAQAVLVITTRVDFTNATVTNVAVVTTKSNDNNTENDKANNTTHVDPVADLAIGKFVSNMHPAYNAEFTYIIAVTNNGPDTAANAFVYDLLPKGVIYISDDSEGKYDPETGIWTIGDLASGDGAILEILVKVDVSQPTVIVNYANVTSETYDPDLTNNEDDVPVDVGHKADLEVIKEVYNATSKYGDEVLWIIYVINHGPHTAVEAYVEDNLPEGLIYLSHFATVGEYDPETGIWTIGDLEANEDAYETLSIWTKVDVTSANITNIAIVNSTTEDPNPNNNKANNTTDVEAEADLEVVKVVSNANPHYGDEITWTVTVTNHGPNDAKDVTVTDKLPAGLEFVSANGNYNENTGVWIIGELENGASRSLVIRTIVTITNASITNVAVVSSTTPDSNESNNKDNDTSNVVPEADLEIVKLVSAKTTNKGDIITWTIVVTNNGPDAAVNVYAKDTLPAEGLVYKAHTTTKGLFDSNSMLWYISTLSKGESATLTVDTLVTVANTELVNNVNVTNDVYDPNENNNKADNSTTVNKEKKADLEIVKIVSDSNPHKGDVITWTITVVNNGPDAATGVTVTDKLPSGLIFVAADGNYNKDTGVWTVGDLDNGKSATLVISTIVDITNAEITNVAVANSTTDDPNPNNNKDNDTTNVVPEADVKVIKTVSNPNPRNGDVITWTVVVSNLGPDAAENVIVEEALPEGLQLQSAKGSKGSYDDGVWTVGTLNNGEIATLTLTTKVTISSGTIENVVVAKSSTYDPNQTNNRDKEVTNPKAKTTSADLELIKKANVDKVKVGDKIIWTITVINHGPDKAIGVYVQDILDAGDVEFVSAEPDVGEFDEETGMWDIGDMEVGQTAKLIVIFNALSEGDAINYAEVISETPDPNPDNNDDSSTVEIVDGGDNPPVPDGHKVPTPSKNKTPTMHATGNPIVMVLLALFAIAGVSLRRKI